MRLMDSMAGSQVQAARRSGTHGLLPYDEAFGSAQRASTMQSRARKSERTGSGVNGVVFSAWRACAWAAWPTTTTTSGESAALPTGPCIDTQPATSTLHYLIACTYRATCRQRRRTWQLDPFADLPVMSQPTVLYPLSLPGLLDYILSTQSDTARTVLVICSSRETFLADLLESLQQGRNDDQKSNLHDLSTPTLYNLSTTQHVKLVFCPSVQALLAYLTAYGLPQTKDVGHIGGRERLVLVNLLAMHAPTTSFSAQGLSRAFATAAETALRTGAVLQVVECQGRPMSVEEPGEGEEDTVMEDEHEQENVHVEVKDPWDQEVSILNVSARRFGSGSGERAWAGRTVKARRIAGRWFRFRRVQDHHTSKDPE